jgi:hypothetical protein
LSELNPVKEVEIIKISLELKKKVRIKFPEDLSTYSTVIKRKDRKRHTSTKKYVMRKQAYLSPEAKRKNYP